MLAVSRCLGLLLPWLGFALILFLPIAAFLGVSVSPALFGQGKQAFTLANFARAFSGYTLHSLLDSALVGLGSAIIAVLVGTALALVLARTNLALRGLWTLLMWALLLAPSYLDAYGWQLLVEPQGTFDRLFGGTPKLIEHAVLGPAGVLWILATRGMPFAFLAASALVSCMGRDFEDAARVHGASRPAQLRLLLGMLAPALWAGFAIVFAESISDYGVAATLAAQAHFPIATFAIFEAVDNFPTQFGLASSTGALLMILVLAALVVQSHATRGRSYAMLSGRTRPRSRVRLAPRHQAWMLAVTGAFFVLALGVPIFASLSASLLSANGATGNGLTLANYRQVFASTTLRAPLLLSGALGAITASVAVVLGLVAARMLAAQRPGRVHRVLDLCLLGALALPAILLGAGYIFVYNLPFVTNELGIRFYGTLAILLLGYCAGAVPTTARLLVGPMAQVQSNVLAAARVHGASWARSWRSTMFPLLSAGILWAWLYGFGSVVFELPISQLLYPPGHQTLSVAINNLLSTYYFGTGTATMVVSVLGTLLVIGVVLAVFRLVTPAGWRQGAAGQ